MIDLSFLTEEEQEAIMKVLQRDAELKKAEEERVRHLPEKVKDDVQLKNMSGQWFYEAKSKRHRDKIHGADIIRTSMRRKPATLAEVSQSKSNKAKDSWVSNVNKEVFAPPELHGIVEHQEEEEELKSSSSSNPVTSSLENPGRRSVKAAASTIKQRRNPFNSILSSDNLNSGESESRQAILPQLSNKDIEEILLPSEESQSKANLLNDGMETSKKPSEEPAEESQKGPVERPVPKARKLVHKVTNPVPQGEDFFPKPAKRTQGVNGIGALPRGILKRSSSSSSTDSEARANHMFDVQSKNSIPTISILEGETDRNSLTEEAEDSTQISLEKLKQVRFSSSIGKEEPLQSPRLHHGRETRESDLLKSGEVKTRENDANRSDSCKNKQTYTGKPLETYSSSLQVRTIDSLQEDTSASSPNGTNESVSLVNQTLQTKTITPKKLETPEKASTNILPKNKNEQNVDQTCENNSKSLSHESKSLKNFTDKGKINIPKEELALSAEDVSTVPSQPDKPFSNPEKVKGLSKSVPSFLQEESDERETDTASESSYSFGRIKKSPSSLTNLSGSSGMASLSSVSGSLMSVYSGDFGSVDVKGNIQFAIDYVEQLNELHIFICQCKDLAVADVKRQRSDPYVKTYLLPEKYKLGKRKTSVKKKTFNPVFNEILRYKIEKDLLKNQSLNISVWHNDTFGRNSFLGEVELDLGTWDWNDKSNKQINWFPLKPRTSAMAFELENRGEMKLALQYVPQPVGGKKIPSTGEVHIWVKECRDLPLLRGNRLNSFIKCTILPDTSRKSRQKTRTVSKTTNPVFNHTMVYDGFRPEDLKEACVELTVWDHNKLVNHFLGGLRIGLGTGKSYGTTVDWMDSTSDESALWEKMIKSPNTWVEDTLPLRMLMVAKLTK
ncbi:synaptotagmin-like protein 2 isoform X11 [Lagopus muta]|uniref:synaptotagmin-like protein 2 isoform X11 n=1 Tax=Lagopus muta TaxID=64668 RepID=UPI0020A076C6|nr:synaptotagmin-like protein 2 isoform X11 [Lagopus muta]